MSGAETTMPSMTHCAPAPTDPQALPEVTPPITMFGPDFPFAYDDWLQHPAGLGLLPANVHGTDVAVIGGGLAGIVAA